MRIASCGLSLQEIATQFFERTKSTLGAMIRETQSQNYRVVFILNRPFFEVCYNAMWCCVVEGRHETDDSLDNLGREIDANIEQQFKAWDPNHYRGVNLRYEQLLDETVHEVLVDAGKLSRRNLIGRLHNDVHGGLDSVRYYKSLQEHGSVYLTASELCIVAHKPLYSNLRYAMSRRFPEGPIKDWLIAPFLRQYTHSLLKEPAVEYDGPPHSNVPELHRRAQRG